ncbi:hypothetical protein ACA910_008321 [Epithemia clementina (nom. ined.)]
MAASVNQLSETNQTESDLCLSSLSTTLCPRTFANRIIAQVRVHNEHHDAASLFSDRRHSEITPETLSQKWNIGLDTAKQTLRVTTQLRVRTAIHPLHRRYRTNHTALRYPRLNETFYSDNLFSKVTSIKGNKCAQVFTNGRFTYVHPMTSKKDAGFGLQGFVEDVGVPAELVTDLAGEETGHTTEFQTRARELRVKMRHTEARSPRQNQCEAEIGTLKRRWRSRMARRKIPRRLWDFGLVYEAEILSRTARGPDGRTGIEEITGNMTDISEWADFAFYDLVLFWHQPHPDVSSAGRELGQWLGVSHQIGSNLCYWVINSKGKVQARTTVQHVTNQDVAEESVRNQVAAFDSALNERLNDKNYTTNKGEAFWLEDEEEMEPHNIQSRDGTDRAFHQRD